ncbi:MAG: endonuclease/exonuclease/phosphatase family protein [Pseudonocardiaceae bacterium]
MRLRVVSWNVDSRPTGLLDAKVDLLRRLRPDLALLQEIGRPVYRALLPHPSAHERMHRQSRLFAWGALSTDLSDPRGSEFRLGCAVLGIPSTALLDAQVLDKAPFGVRDPVRQGFLWRTMATRVALSTGDLLTAGSFHGRQGTAAESPTAGPPAAALQRAFHTGIAEWLARASGPVVFGIDAGAPVDDADPLLGPESVHDLTDVLRATDDHLWASRDFEVLDVQCLAAEATAAGSDHPLLLADVALRTS